VVCHEAETRITCQKEATLENVAAVVIGDPLFMGIPWRTVGVCVRRQVGDSAGRRKPA
jgi:hypothetical protein